MTAWIISEKWATSATGETIYGVLSRHCKGGFRIGRISASALPSKILHMMRNTCCEKAASRSSTRSTEGELASRRLSATFAWHNKIKKNANQGWFLFFEAKINSWLDRRADQPKHKVHWTIKMKLLWLRLQRHSGKPWFLVFTQRISCPKKTICTKKKRKKFTPPGAKSPPGS